MSLPALVIFDCDGVLVDSEQISHGVLHTMLLERGVEISFDETVLRFIGASSGGFVDGVSDLCGGSVPPGFVDVFKLRMQAAFEERLTVVPGVDAMLAALQIPFCVASNGMHQKMRFTLGKTGLLERFAGRMFSAEDVANPKPAPDLFLHAAHSLSALPGSCVVIEDTPTGIKAARAAGMRALGYAAMTPRSRLVDAGAHAVFDNMQELPSLLAVLER